MKRMLWAVALVALVAALPPASAEYGAGSLIEADAPALLQGRTDALVAHGVASLLANDASVPFLVSIEADELSLSYQTVPPACTSAAPAAPGIPTTSCTQAQTPAAETATLTSARVELVKALSAYKLVVTNDESYGETSTFIKSGDLVATSGAGTVLGANAKALHISPYLREWRETTNERDSPTGPIYEVEALEPNAAAQGGSLRAHGGMQALLQGLRVKVSGTDASGQPFERTFETPFPDEGDETRFLVLEMAGGDLRAFGDGPLATYGVKTADVRGSVALSNANGRIVDDGAPSDLAGSAVTLDGPVSLTVTGTKQGSPPRVTYALSSNLLVAALFADPPERQDPAQLVAAGAAGAGGATLLAALVYFWPRVKFASTLLFLPMYTRIERTAVLEHEKRDEIYELIRTSPGIHAHEIGEKTNIGWGTTVYHLKMLEQHSLIVSKKSGRYKRFFVNTGEYTKKKDVYGALRNETAKSVADYIVNHPGCNQKEMCAALGIQPSLASWHVEKLEGVELVKRVKDGRQVRYFAGPAWELLNVRVHPGGGADTPAET